MLKRAKLPVVDVSADRLKSEFPRATIDDKTVARLAVAHLQDKGLRAIAFIGDKRFVWSRQRDDEYRRLMKKLGEPRRIYKERAGILEGEGSDSELRDIAQWLKNLPRPAGIFACYDNRALQVLEACQLCELSVPGDVAVIGVDDDEVLCQLSNPPLTSVLPNARLTGYEAAAMLSRMMQGERLATQTRYIEPLRVVERQSTDITAVNDPKIAAALRYINEHACEGINVNDVLKAVPVSRTLFDSKFKILLGHSPHEHIINKRIERARQLLSGSDLTITVIAELVGFPNTSYFSTVFHRTTHITPYAYRASLRGTQAKAGTRSDG
jgi:LacI family transcriptional regulator